MDKIETIIKYLGERFNACNYVYDQIDVGHARTNIKENANIYFEQYFTTRDGRQGYVIYPNPERFDDVLKSKSDLAIRYELFKNKSGTSAKILKTYLAFATQSRIKIMIIVDSSLSLAKSLFVFSNPYFELIPDKKLMFNLTKYCDVPEHTIVHDVDTLRELKKIGKLPIILPSDPMTIYYDARRGDIFKIIRGDGKPIYRVVGTATTVELDGELEAFEEDGIDDEEL